MSANSRCRGPNGLAQCPSPLSRSAKSRSKTFCVRSKTASSLSAANSFSASVSWPLSLSPLTHRCCRAITPRPTRYGLGQKRGVARWWVYHAVPHVLRVRHNICSFHVQRTSRCPLSANSGLMQRSKGSLFDQPVGERKQIRGILRPSALAVARLMTNSILTTCWTGRSAVVASLKLLPA